jgi:hypothetical protein
VRVFWQNFTLEDAIGSHACSLQANMRVANGIPFGCSLLLPVDTVNCVRTLKARMQRPRQYRLAIEDPIEVSHDLGNVYGALPSLAATSPLSNQVLEEAMCTVLFPP